MKTINIPQAIKSVRAKLKISQRELADRIGITRSRIADYETSRSRIPAEDWIKIHQLLQQRGKKKPIRCPKCSGLIVRGGVRFGMAANDIQYCANCGLNSESGSYLDAEKQIRVDLTPEMWGRG